MAIEFPNAGIVPDVYLQKQTTPKHYDCDHSFQLIDEATRNCALLPTITANPRAWSGFDVLFALAWQTKILELSAFAFLFRSQN
jgi:hypothetical protein